MEKPWPIALLVVALTSGCDESAPAAFAPDAASPDAASPDAASTDAASPDAASPDPEPFLSAEAALDTMNLFIGAGGLAFGYAALTPAAQVPLGMVRFGPDTSLGGIHPSFHHFSGYHADDPHIRGFSHTHFVGTGVVDYGNLRILPLAMPLVGSPFLQYLPIRPGSQQARPGVYEVSLDTPAVDVALTASTRGGLGRFTFTEGPSTLFFDLTANLTGGGVKSAAIELTPEGQLQGSLNYGGDYTNGRGGFFVYFNATFEPPPRTVTLHDALGPIAGTEATGLVLGAMLDFGPLNGVPALVRTGVSYVDIAGATANRMAELDGRAFDETALAARALWLSKSSRLRVAGGTLDQRTILHTAHYNTYRMPTRFDDVDGRYTGVDHEVHTAVDFGYHTDLSLWDTFRTLHPFYVLSDHDAQRDCLRSLLAMRDDGGQIPRWPAATSDTNGMIGTSADIVFADSAVKGVDQIDYASAFASLRETATAPVPPGSISGGRGAIEIYQQLGYVPIEDDDNSVSVTLEYAYDDYALGQLAAFLGLDGDAAMFGERGHNWRNLLDPETGFLVGRRRDGTLRPPTTLVTHGDQLYTEGTAWQWSFYAPHDGDLFAEALGGKTALGERLEALFSQSALGGTGRVSSSIPDNFYWHGNEPAIHSAYLFLHSDRPHRADYWLREIQTRLYHNDPAGLAGNDDGGTLSSWYIFSALGLYPIAGSDRYWVGTPLFSRAELDLPSGGLLRIEAPGADLEHRYVWGVTLNGQSVGRILRHETLAAGGELRFDLKTSPPP